eukprot:886801-Prorocentrum_lima.AAC.1
MDPTLSEAQRNRVFEGVRRGSWARGPLAEPGDWRRFRCASRAQRHFKERFPRRRAMESKLRKPRDVFRGAVRE